MADNSGTEVKSSRWVYGPVGAGGGGGGVPAPPVGEGQLNAPPLVRGLMVPPASTECTHQLYEAPGISGVTKLVEVQLLKERSGGSEHHHPSVHAALSFGR